ncbi:hypothetical protein EDB87DRAFT_1581649 [Lactarius vividus]|nr:hypothetical protein EDB87DRAFT_1581649 [Lactarius vividus]
MSRYSYTDNDFPPEHLADVCDALMDDSGEPGRREYHDNSSDLGKHITNNLQPNPNATEASGLDLSLGWADCPSLAWLNPLVHLGAPSVYSGPSCPPSPTRPTNPLPTDDLDRAISNAVARLTLLLAQGMMALSGSIESQNSILAPPPSIPLPSPILIKEDSPMPPPPPPTPAAAPATAPAPVSTPCAKKQKPAKAPTPAAVPPAKAPIPTPPAKPTPPPRASFALAVRLPVQPSLVVTPHHTVGSLAPVGVRRNPQELITHLNSMLLEGGHAVTLSAAWWTVKNNLVLTAGPDTTAHHLNSTSHIISDSLAVFLSADTTSPLPVLAWDNCKWGCLTINGIPTRASLTCGPYSPFELHAALLTDNPMIPPGNLLGVYGRPNPLCLWAFWGVEVVEGETLWQRG